MAHANISGGNFLTSVFFLPFLRCFIGFRRKLKPHELDAISANKQLDESCSVSHEEYVEQEEYEMPISDDETQVVRRRTRRTSSRKGSSSSPKTR